MRINSPTNCPYYLISRATLQITSALKREFTLAGVEKVKPSYLGVFLSLWQEDGLKAMTLGYRAGLEPSTITGLLDRMERDSFVSRLQDPEDRRSQKIFLTEEGKRVQKPVLTVVEKTLSQVLYGISEKEMDGVKDILRRILANAREAIHP